MAPRRAPKNTDQVAAPSSEAAGGRVTRRSANQPQATAPSDLHPTTAQATSTRGQARNFAPLGSGHSGRGTGSGTLQILQPMFTNLSFVRPIFEPKFNSDSGDRSRIQFPSSTPIRNVPPSRVQTLPPTPARVVSHQLVEQLGPQSAMASPGPRHRDPGNDDSESEGAEEFDFESGLDSDAPPTRRPPPTSRTAAESPAIISFNSDDEGSPPPTRAGQRGVGRRTGRSTRRDQGPSDTANIPSDPAVQPQPQRLRTRTDMGGHTVDEHNFAWAEESVLRTASTPKMKYFSDITRKVGRGNVACAYGAQADLDAKELDRASGLLESSTPKVLLRETCKLVGRLGRHRSTALVILKLNIW
ncbi:hypothetical protein B0H14DRAFT_2587490 [Mycena olivaceomarginata]|nr:hypothetical protein B0H14DRAFT_2587490 [Mycena olivaceomarginata]